MRTRVHASPRAAALCTSAQGSPGSSRRRFAVPASSLVSSLLLRRAFLLQVAQPTPFMHQLELRRSQGFAMGPYNECLRRIEGLYKNILDITGESADADDQGNEGAIERRGCVLWAEGDYAPAVVLPAPLSTHLYMSLLSCRFDADEPTSVVWNSGEMIRLIREVLQPVVLLSDAEHYACTASVSEGDPARALGHAPRQARACPPAGAEIAPLCTRRHAAYDVVPAPVRTRRQPAGADAPALLPAQSVADQAAVVTGPPHG